MLTSADVSQALTKEVELAVSYPIANDDFYSWPVRTDATKFVFPKTGYYTVSGNVVFRSTASPDAGYRNVFGRMNGVDTIEYGSVMVYYPAGSWTAIVPFSFIIKTETTGDYLQIFAFTNTSLVTINHVTSYTVANDSDIQIRYLESL
jgi:hypothetical protein